MKRTFTAFLFYLLLVQTLPAQIVPPAEWRYSLPNVAVVTGSEVELVFKAKIPATYHIYSNDYVCEVGPLPSEFKFEPHPSYKLQGKARAIGAKKYFDDVFNCDISDFSRTAEFRQKVKVLAPNPIIRGVLEYQMCTDEGLCVLHEYDFVIEGLRVSGEAIGAESAPLDPKNELADTTVIHNPPVELNEDRLVKLLAQWGGVGKSTKSQFVPIPSDSVDYRSYRGNGPADKGSAVEKVFPGSTDELVSGKYWSFFLISFISGLLALLTPCVFPMIPMTITFFMKEGQSKAKGIRNGLIYGLSIIAIYTLIGTVLSVTVGPAAANFLSTHWLPNLLFFLIFWVFAASFFGAFEIVLPSWLVNKVDRKADQGGLMGIFFMAFTIVLVSFSCTGPIVGSILVSAFGGEVIMPAIGMFGFSLAFALPFGLFAIFPNWLSSLPQSGGWLNSVKVVLGFLELALGLKFLSVADQTYHWGILDREVYIALWIVIFTLLGIYLLGKIKFSHDSDLPFLKVPRLLFAVVVFSFVVYLVPGMIGAPLHMLAGYLPPMSTHDFNLVGILNSDEQGADALCDPPKYKERLHLPHGIQGYFDYEQGMECARQQTKPVFIDFTGHGCVNCREMESRVWSDPRVLELLKRDYVVISLYVDDKTLNLSEDEKYFSRVTGKQVSSLARKNADIQMAYFKGNAQPLYALLDNRGELLAPKRSYNLDKQAFVQFLESGKKEYMRRMESRQR